MTCRKPTKARPQVNRGMRGRNTAIPNSSAAPSTLTTSTPTGKRNRHAPNFYGFESWVCAVSESQSIPAPKKLRTTNPVIAMIIQEDSTQPPPEEISFELPVVNPSHPLVRPFTNSPQIMIMPNMIGKSACVYLMQKTKSNG